jgi:hypothetical protein
VTTGLGIRAVVQIKHRSRLMGEHWRFACTHSRKWVERSTRSGAVKKLSSKILQKKEQSYTVVRVPGSEFQAERVITGIT